MTVRLIKQRYLTSLDVVFNDADVKSIMTLVRMKDSSAKAHFQYIIYKGTVYRQSAEKKIFNTEFGDYVGYRS